MARTSRIPVIGAGVALAICVGDGVTVDLGVTVVGDGVIVDSGVTVAVNVSGGEIGVGSSELQAEARSAMAAEIAMSPRLV